MSDAYHGACHDYTMLKNEFDPSQGTWFDQSVVYVDLGFLGIRKDYYINVHHPYKKPPKKELSTMQKDVNTVMSKIRVKVEHAIGGFKRFRLLSDRLRMRNMTRYNQIVRLCAGLWNFNLKC